MGPYYINQMRLSRGRAAVICLVERAVGQPPVQSGLGPAHPGSRSSAVPLRLPCQPATGVLGTPDLPASAGQGRAGPELPLGRAHTARSWLASCEGWGRGLDDPGPVTAEDSPVFGLLPVKGGKEPSGGTGDGACTECALSKDRPVALHGTQTPHFLYPSDSLRTLSSVLGPPALKTMLPQGTMEIQQRQLSRLLETSVTTLLSFRQNLNKIQ
ncbi:uncharacterized protein LOC111092046 isoform X2 [Canis lupus familiaris]|uniref:uncharacterized protein LOC111092046 isoform X2 n=1 Tax=Canis lupus familiaris TaxID=9615 RepID=UPI000BAA14DC|nr:uncharacterized protein LOC111092046 isoform X2 [Canis lupus familiaris]XP_038509618.1 uncharacterized protein LOC111092046 isoform X2 [Canis lupus familiaris]|eukprot:XP_022264663.1 uncharacterized protein LOC111092046 isoform X2 [Canis lupus familiaris]